MLQLSSLLNPTWDPHCECQSLKMPFGNSSNLWYFKKSYFLTLIQRMNTGKVLGQWAPLTFYNSGGWVVCCGFLCAPNPVSLSHGEICCGPCKYLDIIVIVCLTSAPWVLSIVPLFDILYKPLLKFLLLELLFLCTYALGQMMMFTVFVNCLLMLFLLTSYNCYKRTGWYQLCLLLVANVPLLHVSDCPLLTESRSCVTRSENAEFRFFPISILRAWKMMRIGYVCDVLQMCLPKTKATKRGSACLCASS